MMYVYDRRINHQARNLKLYLLIVRIRAYFIIASICLTVLINEFRPHSSLGDLSPEMYIQQHEKYAGFSTLQRC